MSVTSPAMRDGAAILPQVDPRQGFRERGFELLLQLALVISLVMLVVSIGVLVALRDHWLGTP